MENEYGKIITLATLTFVSSWAIPVLSETSFYGLPIIGSLYSTLMAFQIFRKYWRTINLSSLSDWMALNSISLILFLGLFTMSTLGSEQTLQELKPKMYNYCALVAVFSTFRLAGVAIKRWQK